MIHLLVVGPEERDLAPPPAIELLRAATPEEAADRLARHRRIDAVLFLDPELARKTLSLLDPEDTVPPPSFVAGEGGPPGATPLRGADLLAQIARALSG